MYNIANIVDSGHGVNMGGGEQDGRKVAFRTRLLDCQPGRAFQDESMGLQTPVSRAPALRLSTKVREFLKGLDEELYEVVHNGIAVAQRLLTEYMRIGAPVPLAIPYYDTVLFLQFDRKSECYWVISIFCDHEPDLPPSGGGGRARPTITESLLVAVGIDARLSASVSHAPKEHALCFVDENEFQETTSAPSLFDSNEYESVRASAHRQPDERDGFFAPAGDFARLRGTHSASINFNWTEVSAETKKFFASCSNPKLIHASHIRDGVWLMEVTHHGERIEPNHLCVRSSEK